MGKMEWIESVRHRIAYNLREMRMRHNMTLSALHQRTGLSWKVLENWELEKTSPSVERLMWLCKCTGWKLSEILGGLKDG